MANNWKNYGIKITDHFVLDPESENAVVVPDGVGASTVGAYPVIAQTMADSVGDGEIVSQYPDSWVSNSAPPTDADKDFLDDSSEVSDDFIQAIFGTFDAKGAAVDRTATAVGDKVDEDGHVKSITLKSVAAVTANATNYRTFEVRNTGKNGAGTTVLATFATDTPTTDDLAAGVAKELTLTGVTADLKVKEGDIIKVIETHTGSGVAHSGYDLTVKAEQDPHAPVRDHQ